ncbi:MAG: aminotransferase class V-fold PLP-dependent enzyme [bacterium]
MTEEQILNWRQEFPILAQKIHVANCSQGPQSKRVRESIDAYLKSWQTAGMDWELWLEEVFKAKQEFARLIHAEADEIALSTSASAATASVASALNLSGRRNKVVTTEAEFPTVVLVWLAHQKYGLQVAHLPLQNGRIPLQAYRDHVDETTLLASATHIYYQNGFKQDLQKIAEIVHQRGAWLFVDAYQSLGVCQVDVRKMDIDFLISGNLKYLLGIPGIAFLYVKNELVESLRPALTGWFGQADPFAFDSKYLSFANDSRRFETGTPSLITAYAARAGMQIINEVGSQNIEARIRTLSDFTVACARQLGLEYAGPENLAEKGAITAIKVPNPHKVESLLKERNIIASARGEVIRIAPHFFTTLEDIEQVLMEISKIIRQPGGVFS